MDYSPVRQEDDVIRTKPVALALFAAVLLSAGAVLWGWLELRADVAAYRPRGMPHVTELPTGSPVIGGVFQTLIDVDSSTATLFASKRERLESWGWVDQANGVVHIPIGAAMRTVVEEARQ